MPLKSFEWIKDISKFDESFIKKHNEESEVSSFLEVDVAYSENLHNLHNDLLLLSERMEM